MIFFERHADVCKWASKMLFKRDDGFDDKARAMSIIKDDKLIAAVIYTQYQPNISMELSIVSVDKRWATRHNLRAFFSYPFIDNNVKRVTTLCSANERDIIMFNKRLGFKPEGYHRRAYYDGSDAVSFGMLKSECRWL